MMTSSYQMAFTSIPWQELYVETSPYIFEVLAARFLPWFLKEMFLRVCWLIWLFLMFSSLPVFKITQLWREGWVGERQEEFEIEFLWKVWPEESKLNNQKLCFLVAMCCWLVRPCWWTSLYPCNWKTSFPLPCLIWTGWPRGRIQDQGYWNQREQIWDKGSKPMGHKNSLVLLLCEMLQKKPSESRAG